MKKTIKVISLLLVCIICIFCISGCGEQSDEIQIDNVVQALKNNGFSDAGTYVEENETRISLSSDEECYLTLEYIQCEEINQNRIDLKNVSIDTDLENILKAILPLYGVDLSKVDMRKVIDEIFSEEMKRAYEELGGPKEFPVKIYEKNTENIYCVYDVAFSENGYKDMYLCNAIPV